jgi:hypothetical protein
MMNKLFCRLILVFNFFLVANVFAADSIMVSKHQDWFVYKDQSGQMYSMSNAVNGIQGQIIAFRSKELGDAMTFYIRLETKDLSSLQVVVQMKDGTKRPLLCKEHNGILWPLNKDVDAFSINSMKDGSYLNIIKNAQVISSFSLFGFSKSYSLLINRAGATSSVSSKPKPKPNPN